VKPSLRGEGSIVQGISSLVQSFLPVPENASLSSSFLPLTYNQPIYLACSRSHSKWNCETDRQ